MKPVRYFTLMGEKWEFRYLPTLNTLHAYCDHDKKQVVIAKDSTKDDPELFMDCVIHECLHGACPQLSEDFVNEFASDVAKVLIRMGFQQNP